MSIETGEYILFVFIVICQIIFFTKTRRKINQFKSSIPNVKFISISDLSLTPDQISQFVNINASVNFTDPNVIFEETEEDTLQPDAKPDDDLFTDRSEEPLISIKILSSNSKESEIFENILFSINKYLVRNRHSVADFNLIKDIVERNTDAIEDEINLTISTPLYLGLMGTMLGIVIGLFSMSQLFNVSLSDKDMSSGIAILLGSVKIAMIASFVGLVLTIINSSIIFKGTKYKLEVKKNEFYTFVQVELLPSLNQGISATFESLQRNLSRFNEKFDFNLERLSTVFDKNYDSILLYKELLQELDKNKVVEITKYNVQVLKELNISVTQFEKFNTLFNNVNKYLNGTYQLTNKTNELLERTSNFEQIAHTISENLDGNSLLLKFLAEHFVTLESHKQKVDEAIVNVSYGIKDTFDELKKSLLLSSQELSAEATLRAIENQKVFDSFSNDLKKSFENQVETFKLTLEEKKSNLDYLRFLEPILQEVKLQKPSSDQSVSDKLLNQLVELTNVLKSSDKSLKKLEENSKIPFFKKFFNNNKNEER